MKIADNSETPRACYRLVGAIPCAGVISIDDGRLRFEPRGMVSAMLAGEVVSVAVEDIDEVRIAGPDRHLTVVAGGHALRFTGRGARDLYAPLSQRIASEAHVQGNVVSLFGGPDHVVIRGSARLYVNRFMAVGGEVSLGVRTLRFEPTSRLEVWAWGTPTLEVPLHEITAVRVRGARRLLTVDTGRRAMTIGGGVVPSLLGALRILRGGAFQERVPPGERELVVDVWRGRLQAGGRPVSRAGTLVVGTHRLVFVPGTLRAAEEDEALDIPLADLTRIELHEGTPRRIRLHAPDGGAVIHLGHAGVRFRELARLLGGLRRPEEPVVLRTGAVDTDAFASVVASWTAAGRLGAVDEQVLHAGPAVEWVGSAAARRGLLGLTTARVLFLPCSGPAGSEQPVEATLALMAPDEPGDRTISLGSAADGPFVPRGGRLFVEAFWARWRTLGPVPAAGPRLRPGQPVEAVLGPCLVVHVSAGGEDPVTLRDARLEQAEGGIGLVFEGTADRALDRGREVGIEVARTSGLFRFGGRVAKVEPVDRGTDRPAMLVTLEDLTDICQVEHRGGFRVRASDSVEVHRLTVTQRRGQTRGEAVEGCSLDDLSMVGCALRAPVRLEAGVLLSVELPLQSGLLGVEAEVVRMREDPGTRRFVHGLRFMGLTAASRDRIHADILRRQREAVTHRNDGGRRS